MTEKERYNRRNPVACKALGDTKEAWFYINEGSIVVVTDAGSQARITRRQLLDALHAMRTRGRSVHYVRP